MSLLLLFKGAGGGGAPQSTTFPDVVVQIGFDAGPSTALSATSWTNIDLSLVRSITTNRGRSVETDDFQAGTCQITLDNSARTFDPDYTSGPYYGKLLPLRRMRVLANYAGVTYPLFNGFTPDEWPQEYDPPNDSHVTLDCVDGFFVLQQADTPASVLAYEQSVDSPKLQLSFSDGSTLVTASDSSGNGYDGTYVGSVSSASALSYGGDGAVSFAAGSSAVFPIAAALSDFRDSGVNSTGITVEAVIQTSETSGLHEFIYWQLDTVGHFKVELHLDTDGSPIFGWVHDGGGTGRTSGVPVNDGLTHHLVGRVQYFPAVDGTTTTLWVDGVSYSTVSTGLSASAAQGVRVAGQLEASTDSSSFTGTIDDLATFQSMLSDARIAAHYAAVAAPWNGDVTGARVGRLLDVTGWPTADRNLDTGNSVLGSQAFSGTPLDLIKAIEASEQGRFFISADGLATFYNRYVSIGGSQAESTSTTSQATFGDGGGSELPYFVQGFRLKKAPIRNNITGQRDGGAEITIKDSTSVSRYGKHNASLPTLQNTNDNEIRALIEYQLQRYAEPVTICDGITIKPQSPSNGVWTSAQLWAAVLGFEISKRYTLKRRPQNVGTVISLDVLLEGVSHHITPMSWECTPYFSAADSRTDWFILDTGQLDTNVLCF